MDPIAIIIGLILLGAASAFVFMPFRVKPRHGPKKVTTTFNAHEARTAALSALRDLDFDFQTGKVSGEDYPALRAQLVAEAAKYVEAESAEENRLEALIRARKAAMSSEKPCPQCGKKLDAGARFCPHCGTELATACPSCGKPVHTGDLFCGSCGAKLELRAEAIV
jgi:transcription elongation factor Elf1